MPRPGSGGWRKGAPEDAPEDVPGGPAGLQPYLPCTPGRSGGEGDTHTHHERCPPLPLLPTPGGGEGVGAGGQGPPRAAG